MSGNEAILKTFNLILSHYDNNKFFKNQNIVVGAREKKTTKKKLEIQFAPEKGYSCVTKCDPSQKWSSHVGILSSEGYFNE